MVQLGATTVTESQKDAQGLKKPAATSTDVVVVVPTVNSPVKVSCCTTRVKVAVAVTCVLLALAIGGAGLYIRHRLYRHCIDWGCGDDDGIPYGHDYLSAPDPRPFDAAVWPSSDGESSDSSASLIIEPFPYPEYGDRDGDHHGDGDHRGDGDRDGDRDGDHHGRHPPPPPPPGGHPHPHPRPVARR